MFTGLIEEIGFLEKKTKRGKGFLLSVSCKRVLEGLKVGDSIAVNGICLTVSAFNKNSFSAFVMNETIEMTTMSINKRGTVNLERALLLGERLGGHIVMGHITGIGEIKKIVTVGASKWFYLNVPEGFDAHCQYKGSIAIDGASLTIAYLKGETLGVSIIPHTKEKTILQTRKVGDKVNLERALLLNKGAEKKCSQVKTSKISQLWLREVGF